MTRGIPVALLIAVLLLLPLFVHDAYFLHVLILIGINVMVAVSMWLLGITGLISFGQAGFMFIGAMTTALLTKLLHWPFWVALPLSAIDSGPDRRTRRPPEPAREGRVFLPGDARLRPGGERRLRLLPGPVRRLVRHP